MFDDVRAMDDASCDQENFSAMVLMVERNPEEHLIRRFTGRGNKPDPEEESCPVYDIDNEEEESMPIYDTDIEDFIEEEEGFVGKGGFGGEEDNIEDVVVVANDLCSLMIQTILSVDFEEDINTKSHELMLRYKSWNSSLRVDSGSSICGVPTLIPVCGWFVWEWLASLEHVLTALIEVEGLDEHWGSTIVGRGPLIMPGFFGVSVTKLATGLLIDGSSCDRIDMVIKDLDLEPKIDAMMRAPIMNISYF
nr:hypothetical protein [Tanacetum cinerariifolium]